jgi:hypothetical protein
MSFFFQIGTHITPEKKCHKNFMTPMLYFSSSGWVLHYRRARTALGFQLRATGARAVLLFFFLLRL